MYKTRLQFQFFHCSSVFSFHSTKTNGVYNHNLRSPSIIWNQQKSGSHIPTAVPRINDPTGLRYNGYQVSSGLGNHRHLEAINLAARVNNVPRVNGIENGKHRPVVGHNIMNGNNAYNRASIPVSGGKYPFESSPELRYLLRPNMDIDRPRVVPRSNDHSEDMSGPYNFRQLLRPAEYLPTESLRKRKGGISANGLLIPRQILPEKHVKRRAPLAPNNLRSANVK